MGLVIAIPEIWAAAGTNVPWPTISGTTGHLEYRWSVTSIFAVGLIVVGAFQVFAAQAAGVGSPRRSPAGRGRTAAGRLTRRDHAAPELPPLVYFPLALLAVAAGSLIAAELDSDKWQLAYVLYGLIAVFWIVVPSLAAYFFARDVPFPTLFRTVALLESHVHVVAVVLAAALIVLLLHLALYPWPDIAKVLQTHPPAVFSK
jgi:hypothetical protein